MQYTTLGRTKLRVSVAGLGAGGFSRLGLKAGKTEHEAARLVLEAVDLGINFIDTAAAYGTESVIGRALTSLQRDQIVISTKATVRHHGERATPERLVASIDNSLRVIGIEHIDVFHLHGVQSDDYGYALKTLAPVLEAEKRKGKIRHIGITEAAIADPSASGWTPCSRGRRSSSFSCVTVPAAWRSSWRGTGRIGSVRNCT